MFRICHSGFDSLQSAGQCNQVTVYHPQPRVRVLHKQVLLSLWRGKPRRVQNRDIHSCVDTESVFHARSLRVVQQAHATDDTHAEHVSVVGACHQVKSREYTVVIHLDSLCHCAHKGLRLVNSSLE